MTTEPKWLAASDVLSFQTFLLDQFGGSHGTHDAGLLESALARTKHRFANATNDLFELAATYAHGIAKNHPFLDGNKRTAFVTARVFLGINGQDLQAPEEEVVVMTLGIAAGDIDLATYAAWLRKHSRPAKPLRGMSKQAARKRVSPKGSSPKKRSR